MSACEQSELWKKLSEYARFHLPLSEHLFKTIQPEIDELLFLGRSYEEMFDRFEVLLSLATIHARLIPTFDKTFYGLPGRYSYKYRQSPRLNSLSAIGEEAKLLGLNWSVLKSGMFNNSLEEFQNAYSDLEKQTKKLNWF